MVNIKVCKEAFSESGEIVSIDNDGTVIVQSLRTSIGMMQSGSGTPSASNIRPIVRWDSVVTHRSDTEYGDGNEYLSDLGRDGITAFDIDVITGEVTVKGGLIESYNGETLPGAWLSDRDAYVSGGTPTTGAQVAYELAQPYSFIATPQFINLVNGMNYLWTIAHGKTAKDDSYDGESVTFTATDMTVLTDFTVDFAPKQYGTPGITTETGSIVSFDNPDEVAEIRNVIADFAPIQDGTPSMNTETDDIVSFNATDATNIYDVKADINPIQDLHGYDKPWAGGNGKNIFDIDSIGSMQGLSESDGVFTNTATDSRGFTFCVQQYNGSSYVKQSPTTSVTSTGRASTTIVIDSTITRMRIKHNGAQTDLFFDIPFTKQGTFTISIDVLAYNTSTVGGLKFKDVQIEEGSIMTSYEPYSNICPISGWTECDLSRTGKNLFDDSLYSSFEQSDGSFVGMANTLYSYKRYIKACEVGKTLTASVLIKKTSGSTAANMRIAANVNGSDRDGTRVSADAYTLSQVTFTPTSTSDYVILSYGTNGAVQFKDIQLEVGSTATDYEPYNGNTYIIDLNGTRYGGTLDVTGGVMKVTHGCKKIIASDNWQYRSPSGFFVVDSSFALALDTTGFYYKSDMYGQTNWATKADKCISAYSTTSSAFIIFDSRFTSATDFKAAMPQEGIQIWYPLATPLTVQLTAQQIDALIGTNNIWASTGDVTVNYGDAYPISGWDEVEATRTGKNIFDKTATNVSNGYVANYYLEDSGTEHIYTGAYNISEYIKINPSATYAISGLTGASPSLCFYDAFKNYISGEKYNSRSSFAITSPSNAKYVRISIPVSNIDSVQFENNSATDYEPYKGNLYTIDLDGTRYGGTVDFVSGVMKLSYLLITGLTVAGVGTSSGVRYADIGLTGVDSSKPMLSSHYRQIATSATPTPGTFKIDGNALTVYDNRFTTEAEANAILADVEWCYPLRTPSTVQLTGQEIDALQGQNNIWANSGDVTVTYAKQYPIYGWTAISAFVSPTEELSDADMYFIDLGGTYYGGSVDFLSGKMRVMLYYLNLGSVAWTKVIETGHVYFYTTDALTNIKVPSANWQVADIICSNYVKDSFNNIYSHVKNGTIGVSTSGRIGVYDEATLSLSASDFQTYVDGIQLVYELAEPIEVQLTPQQIELLVGTNHIWSDDGNTVHVKIRTYENEEDSDVIDVDYITTIQYDGMMCGEGIIPKVEM